MYYGRGAVTIVNCCYGHSNAQQPLKKIRFLLNRNCWNTKQHLSVWAGKWRRFATRSIIWFFPFRFFRFFPFEFWYFSFLFVFFLVGVGLIFKFLYLPHEPPIILWSDPVQQPPKTPHKRPMCVMEEQVGGIAPSGRDERDFGWARRQGGG